MTKKEKAKKFYKDFKEYKILINLEKSGILSIDEFLYKNDLTRNELIEIGKFKKNKRIIELIFSIIKANIIRNCKSVADLLENHKNDEHKLLYFTQTKNIKIELTQNNDLIKGKINNIDMEEFFNEDK